jgi:hypothetical protein
MMTETQQLALKMIADPDLCDADWDSTIKKFSLSALEDLEEDDYRCVFYSQWTYARLAKLILNGDDKALMEFIDRVDGLHLVRDRIENQ